MVQVAGPPAGVGRADHQGPDRRGAPIRLAPVPPDTYLTGILATHRARAAADTRRLDDLVARALSCPPTRPFASRLSVPAGGELAVIAEVKRRSPSKGPIDLDPRPRPARRRLRRRRRHVHLGAHRRGLLRRIRPAIWRRSVRPAPSRCCARTSPCAPPMSVTPGSWGPTPCSSSWPPCRTTSSRASSAWPGSSPSTPWSRCTTRPSSTGPSTPAPRSSASTSATSRRSRSIRRAPPVWWGGSPPTSWPWPNRGSRAKTDVRVLADAGYQAVLVGESLVRAPDRRRAVRALTGHRVGARSRAGAPEAGARER